MNIAVKLINIVLKYFKEFVILINMEKPMKLKQFIDTFHIFSAVLVDILVVIMDISGQMLYKHIYLSLWINIKILRHILKRY